MTCGAITPNAGNSSAWDRYSYTLNNPLRYTDPSGHKPCWATSTYLCNLTEADINELYHGSEYEQDFLQNLMSGISIINIDMSPSAVADLIIELESWSGDLNWLDDVGKFLEFSGLSVEVLVALGIFTAPETGVAGGILAFSAGITLDWTQNDLDTIHDDLIKLSDNRKRDINFSFNVYPGRWNVKLDDITTVNHLNIHPMITPKRTFNATPLWIFGWYACDYNMVYGQGCSWGR